MPPPKASATQIRDLKFQKFLELSNHSSSSRERGERSVDRGQLEVAAVRDLYAALHPASPSLAAHNQRIKDKQGRRIEERVEEKDY